MTVSVLLTCALRPFWLPMAAFVAQKRLANGEVWSSLRPTLSRRSAKHRHVEKKDDAEGERSECSADLAASIL